MEMGGNVKYLVERFPCYNCLVKPVCIEIVSPLNRVVNLSSCREFRNWMDEKSLRINSYSDWELVWTKVIENLY